MNVSVNDVPLIIVDFLETHVMPQAEGFTKFKVGMAMAMAHDKAILILKDPEMRNTLHSLGFLNKDTEMLDIGSVYNYAKSAIKHSGRFQFFGYIVDDLDIENMLNSAKKFRGEI